MSKYMIVNGQLREIPDDELMHWKYIKREKKNGRWVYYYDHTSARAELERSKKRADDAWHIALDKAGEMNDAKKARDEVHKIENDKKYTLHDAGMADAKVALSTYDYNEAEAKYNKLCKKYENKKLKYFAHSTISEGLVKVANLFSKVFSKKKKKR